MVFGYVLLKCDIEYNKDTRHLPIPLSFSFFVTLHRWDGCYKIQKNILVFHEYAEKISCTVVYWAKPSVFGV